MGNLTVKQIENAKPKDKPYKLMDGDGLQLRIAVDGIKTWLVRYMFDGKERQYRLPELYGDGDGRIGLKEAREEATHVRALARKGTVQYQQQWPFAVVTLEALDANCAHVANGRRFFWRDQ